MTNRFSLEAIFKAVDKFTKPLVNMATKNKAFTNTLKKDFAKAQRSVMRFGENFKSTMKTAFRIGIGAAIAGTTLLAKKGIELASSLTEVQNVVDTTFGDQSKQVDKWSKSAIKQFGLSELQAKRFSSTIGAMMKPSGITGQELTDMSIKISSLSGDIASFRDLEPDAVFEKLQSIVTGTTKPLREIGVNMTVANLEAFAMSKGITKTYKAMSQSEQIMLRYDYVMAMTTDMQGDYNKTMATSLANQSRTLKQMFFQKLAGAMMKLVPLLINVTSYFIKLLENIDEEKLANNIAKGATALFKFGKGLFTVFKFLKPFIPVILGIIIAWKAYRTALFIAAAAQMVMNAVMTANPIGLIITGIGILIGLLIYLAFHWKQVSAAVQENWDKYKGIIYLFMPPLVIIIELIRSIVKHWGAVKEAFKTKGMLGGILAIGKAILDGILAPIQSLFELLSKIPVLGKTFGKWSKGIGNFREGLFQEKPETPISPIERATYNYNETKQTTNININDNTSNKFKVSTPKSLPYNINLKPSGSF